MIEKYKIAVIGSKKYPEDSSQLRTGHKIGTCLRILQTRLKKISSSVVEAGTNQPQMNENNYSWVEPS